ncbi:hypothetical protein INH39_26395 [Massilia violaceinigra]|uniref:Uncharacterized protein n=1 Tax=Massilia violaceinigra TaxID=2045208 RepID=A0ABY4A2N2_9BURK|nr:hypothetical protein [Massilia violaceinigra]UOD28933.1 hypothetical protein INH39_26395 [Massilia violaceinigra]
MTQISLVLPFALPPPELAPDLIRALRAPALATLLSRSASCQQLPVDDHIRALPHEAWLAQALGASADGNLALAGAVMRGYGLAQPEGTWFIVHPAHTQIARSHLLIADMRRLQLSEAHGRALFELAKPYFDESGKTLLYGDAGTWFMRADDWAALETSTPDAAVGLNLTDWMPKGAPSRAFRMLQNEVQMLWFEHPVNTEREARGLAAINSFWPWGAAPAGAGLDTSRLATSDALPWMAALAGHPQAAPVTPVDALGTDAIVLCDALTEAALATDWAGWLQHMHQLEQALFAPALAALMDGRLKQVQLLLSHRTRHLALTTTRFSQRAFWRRPTLDRLLP